MSLLETALAAWAALNVLVAWAGVRHMEVSEQRRRHLETPAEPCLKLTNFADLFRPLRGDEVAGLRNPQRTKH
ncbi:MAG TPA: hypothetical protein VK701_06680 [Solirubrobacteraceae bacterium]|jgi:hypothetical protein|nr:hypothetical protein [Solirubrobacteraceae bacterium]